MLSSKRGISDLYAVVILISASLVLAIMFSMFIQTAFRSENEVIRIRQLIASERADFLLKLVDYSDDYITILTRRLGNTSKIALFTVVENKYVDCNALIHSIDNGNLKAVYEYPVDNIFILMNDYPFELKYYVSNEGLRLPDKIKICVVETYGNTLITMRHSSPASIGYNNTQVNASSRVWILRGPLEFRTTSDTSILINGTRYNLPAGSLLRIEVDSTRGVINLTSSKIHEISINFSEVFINGTLFTRGGSISISNLPIRPETLLSALTLSIMPASSPTGSVRIVHGGRVIYQGVEPVYIDIVGITVDSLTPLSIRMENTWMNMSSGLSYAIYISNRDMRGALNITIYTLVFHADRAYVIDKYNYVNPRLGVI